MKKPEKEQRGSKTYINDIIFFNDCKVCVQRLICDILSFHDGEMGRSYKFTWKNYTKF